MNTNTTMRLSSQFGVKDECVGIMCRKGCDCEAYLRRISLTVSKNLYRARLFTKAKCSFIMLR